MPHASGSCFRILACLALVLTGCRTRPYEPILPPDFSTPPDLTVPPDFTPPPDLVEPVFCRPIYVIDGDNQMLSAFIPELSKFQDVGIVKCPNQPQTSPDTMSIDLSGFAWIFYTDGSLYTVDLLDEAHACKRTAFDPAHINANQADTSTWQTFGSSFSRNRPDSNDETLFVSLGGNKSAMPPVEPILGAINPVDFTYVVGPPIPTPVELTGTAAAELWLFAPGANPSYVARLDKQTGKTDPQSRIEIPAITVTGGFAFAFWGGSFWIFNGDGPNRSPHGGGGDTTVYRVDAIGDKVTRVLGGTRRYIVGAGVSGCAPLGLDR